MMEALPEMSSWQSRALDFAAAVNELLATASNERELTTALVSRLATVVAAEACLLCLRDEESCELQVRVIVDRQARLETAALECLRELAGQAAASETTTFLEANVPLADRQPGYCLAVPLRCGATNLGAVILLNVDRPFSPDESALVSAAVKHLDAAVQYLRLGQELRRRQKELEAIYRIDRIRDRQLDFEAMLNMLLNEVCHYIQAEVGFLLLSDWAGQQLELRATTESDLFRDVAVTQILRAAAAQAVQEAQPVHQTLTTGSIRSLICQPLILRGRLIGVLGVANRQGRATFTRHDREMLRAICSQIDTAIFENLQTQRLREAFGRCVGPQVMERLLATTDRDILTGERRVITTLFSDIRGFTAMSGKLQPEVLQAVLNDHLSALTDLVLAHEGTLDKYIGDCVMCIFNAPESQPDHAWRAVRLAMEMQDAHRRVMARWEGRVSLPPIGIGISTGEAIVGNFGSVRRLEYTAIGADVNLASRLCAAAQGHQTLVSQSTYALVKEAIIADACPPLPLKGIDDEVLCWEIKGVK